MIASENHLMIRCWGVRGSVPTAEKDKLRVGGNTASVAIRYGVEPLVIIDGGTGLRLLSKELRSTETEPLTATILFSHFHWDHIQGVPFFEPIYSEHTRLKMYSGVPASTLEDILRTQMSQPYFPVPFSSAQAACEYNQIGSAGVQIGSLSVRPVQLNHPGGAFGYRINSPAGSLIYVCDHEHGAPEIDEGIYREAANADVLVYDAHFTPAEYVKCKGWGHSTWYEGAQLARRANVGKLLLFHHSPSRTDQQVQEILREARQEFAGTEAAHENRIICLSGAKSKAVPVGR